MEPKTIDDPPTKALHRFVYGLVYPAVLGTGIVVLGHALLPLSSVGAAFRAPAIWLGIVYLFVFSASFVAGEMTKTYGRKAWGLDLLEVILIFVGFYLLGLLDPHAVSAEHIGGAYWVLMLANGVELGWRKTQNLSLEWSSQWKRYLAMALMLFAACLHYGTIWLVVDALVVLLCIGYITNPKWIARERMPPGKRGGRRPGR